MRLARILAVCLLAGLAGCAVAPAGPRPAAVGFGALPGWQADKLSEAMPALRQTCGRIAALGPQAQLGGANGAPALARAADAASWGPVCAAAATTPDGDDAAARALLEKYLEPHELSPGPDGKALFTGYYEPISPGARHRGGAYQTPIHRRPGNVGPMANPPVTRRVTRAAAAPHSRLRVHAHHARATAPRVLAVPDRASIVAGALRGRGLELAWLADPIDAFFLQIQGSGRITLPDGGEMRVGYAGANGKPYMAIGKILLDRGEITREEMSMQAIRAWLNAHPDQAAKLMNSNPSYVYFREVMDISPDQGAVGAFGVPLTPGRSLAVDRAFIPMGVPVFIATADPLDNTAYQRLLLAQDTGGAIKGAVRADIFYGWGPQAEARAGKMQGTGKAWVLLPRAQPLL